jgi:hypothetical protein
MLAGRGVNSENVTPEQSMLPAPELTNDPVIVEDEQGGAGMQQKSNMVSLADFDLIKVIGRGSYAKVGSFRLARADADLYFRF